MDENAKRWLLFMMITFLVLMTFMPKPKPVPKDGSTETPSPSAEASSTAIPDAGAPEPRPTAPDRPETPEVPDETRASYPTGPGEEILIETRTYEVTFSTSGGHPLSWHIVDPEYAIVAQSDIQAFQETHPGQQPPEPGSFQPIELIPEYPHLGAEREYPLATVLKERGGPFHPAFNRCLYEHTLTATDDGGQTLVLRSPVIDPGLRLTKSFFFPSEGYLVDVDLVLENVPSADAMRLSFAESTRPGLGLTWGPGIGKAYFNDRWDSTFYRQAAYDGERIWSEGFRGWEKALQADPAVQTFSGPQKWALLDSRFYMAALIPRQDAALVRGVVKPDNIPFDDAVRKNLAPPATLEVYSGDFELRPGDSASFHYTLFVGPKKRSLLADIDQDHGYDLRRVMFNNSIWLIRILAVFMLQLLTWFHDFTGNYGISIILVVLVMRLLTQPFTHLGMKSQARVMAEQKRIKPLIDAINEKYKDDPQKRNAEIWKTYKEHGVNPLGTLKGCLWMLIQMPIFFALYRLLTAAIDLRGAGFLWIDDLTAQDALFTLPVALPLIGDKFNLLPILMGVSQVFAQKLQSANIQDPTQKQMATLMPIMFVFILYKFPAGLSLYWFVSNLWQISFQVFVNKRVREEAEAKAHREFEHRKRSAREPEVIVKGKPAAARKTSNSPSPMERITAWVQKKAQESEKRGRKD